MKKTIASVALVMSVANAHAMIGPGHGHGNPSHPIPVEKTYCLSQYQSDDDGSQDVRDCDMTLRNKYSEAPLLSNGCKEGQVALKTISVNIKSCPTATQL